jgi:eukaryotic-like serine/threonine-protein kinase
VAPVPGSHLGAYQIVSLIGLGGMGEVFRARDLRLGRDVAIKTLPPTVAANPDRRARFEREAHLLAALNHPNVAHIYGIEESSGELALVMEFVDGPTVADRIARGPISLIEAVAIAKQIADALEFAHEQGIVHRDLKPANIKVRPDGNVKVLDFGLAKALDPAGSDVNHPTISPTVVHATGAGVILGTAAYMAPEQAAGEPVDRRADVWAFGVVLYEMLTGALLFGRATSRETLAGVLAAPIDFARLPAETPTAVRDLIRRCLQRDRKRRLQHIGDARIALEEALAPPDSSGQPLSRPIRSRSRRWQIAGALALTAVGIIGWTLGRGTSVRAPAGVVRLSIPGLEAPVRGPFGVRSLAISKDGSTIAYASNTGIWIRPIGQREPLKISLREQNPFFSPDGNWVGVCGLGGISKIPARGGVPVLLARSAGRPGGATWSANGTIVFATTDGLYQVKDTGGEVRTLAKPDRARKQRGYMWPHFLPDGQSVLFTMLMDGPIEEAQIARLDLNTLAISVVLSGGTTARYTTTGHILYAAGNVLKAVGFDQRSGKIRGEPIALPDISVANTADNGAAEFAVSDNGTLVFLPPAASAVGRSLRWIDRTGKEEPLPLQAANYTYPRVSPDGARVALDIPDANRDIWIVDLQRTTLTRLTDGPTEDMTPIWSPDGQRVFFASDRTGTFGVYSQAADGASPAKLEYLGATTTSPAAVSPDGTRVFVVSNFTDLMLLDLRTPTRSIQRMLPRGPIYWLGVMSPDGAWIAYESNESGGKTEVFVRPFPNVEAGREKVSIDGGRYPLWGAKNSRELFYVDRSGAMMAASLHTTPTLRVERATKLFDFQPPSSGIGGRPYDVSPVDGRFLVTRPVAQAARTVELSVVMHWDGLLR